MVDRRGTELAVGLEAGERAEVGGGGGLELQKPGLWWGQVGSIIGTNLGQERLRVGQGDKRAARPEMTQRPTVGRAAWGAFGGPVTRRSPPLPHTFGT